MSRVRGVFLILLGVLFIGLAGFMLWKDADYIFLGKTEDLNEILENDGVPPRDSFVTYSCGVCMGNYAETRQYLNGLIPLPGTTQEFAVLGENGMIFSVEAGKKALVSELTRLAEAEYEEGLASPVSLTGSVKTIDSEMRGFLEESFDPEELEDYGLSLSYYVIDTTETRLTQGAMYGFLLLMGAALIVIAIRRVRA